MNKKSRNSLLILASILAVIFVIVTIPYTMQFLRSGVATDSGGPISVGQHLLPQEPLRVVAVGSWDCTKESEETVKNIESKDPHLVIGLGDYSYQGNPDCWLDLVNPIDGKMKIAIGDLDKEPISMREQYLTHFQLPGEYYSFDVGSVHFLALSTEIPDQSAGSSQYSFAEDDLAKAAANPELQWTIVYFHRPIYTTHPHTAASLFRETFHPLFEKYGVDLVIQGHNVNYQRTFPLLFNSQSPPRPNIAAMGENGQDYNATNSASESTYVSPDGMVFVTVGTAGHDPHDKIDSVERFIAFQDDHDFGFLELTVSSKAALASNDGSENETDQNMGLGNNVSILSGTFYANSEIGNQTRVVDSFSIIKKN